jgi:ATP synthase protein I
VAFLLPVQLAVEDHNRARRLAFAIVAGQIGATLLVAALFLLLAGIRAGCSALAGGGIGSVASLYMAVSFFRAGADADPQRILRGVYVGEFVKLVMTALLFVVVILAFDPAFLPLFAAYLATVFVYWMALLKAMPRTGMQA